MLFIVIHQVYELWFKQLLHELAYLQRRLEMGDSSRALGTLKRVLTILKTIVAQIDVLETMTPRQFTTFRDRLDAASGFQSAQFRELEAVLGRRDAGAVDRYPPGSPARERIGGRDGAPEPARLLPALPGGAGLRRPARGARARRHPAHGRLAGGAGRPRRRLPRRRPGGAGLRAPGRRRRGPSGVALPPRQDGRADDRRQGAAPAARRAPRTCARRSSRPPSPTCGRCAAGCEPAGRATTRASASPSGCCSPGTRTRRGRTSRSRATSRPSRTPRATWTRSGGGRSPRPTRCARACGRCSPTPAARSPSASTPTSSSSACSRRSTCAGARGS